MLRPAGRLGGRSAHGLGGRLRAQPVDSRRAPQGVVGRRLQAQRQPAGHARSRAAGPRASERRSQAQPRRRRSAALCQEEHHASTDRRRLPLRKGLSARHARENAASPARRPPTAAPAWSNCTAASTFDLALVDWNMPVMNGLEMLKQLRAEGFSDLKVMMVTTEAENDYHCARTRSRRRRVSDEALRRRGPGRKTGHARPGGGLRRWRPRRRTRILIVDDSAVMRSLLRSVIMLRSQPGGGRNRSRRRSALSSSASTLPTWFCSTWRCR